MNRFRVGLRSRPSIRFRILSRIRFRIFGVGLLAQPRIRFQTLFRLSSGFGSGFGSGLGRSFGSSFPIIGRNKQTQVPNYPPQSCMVMWGRFGTGLGCFGWFRGAVSTVSRLFSDSCFASCPGGTPKRDSHVAGIIALWSPLNPARGKVPLMYLRTRPKTSFLASEYGMMCSGEVCERHCSAS